MAALSRAAMLAMACVVATLLSPATMSSSMPSLISMPTDELKRTSPAGRLTADYHAESCPDLQQIVRAAVEEAFRQDVTIAAGLLRIFFSDCFIDGCDGSLLLNGTYQVGQRVFFSEQIMTPNARLQPKALQLIEDIRVAVHNACGPTVSCADITVLATREAVVVSGGHSYDLLLGRRDSLLPGRWQDVYNLPRPTLNVSQLIEVFGRLELTELDLVALSGAHTIGKAHCSTFSDRFAQREDGEFVQRLAANCSSNRDRLQDLDVETPRVFDNAYYRNLVAGKGVLNSDQTLMHDPRTKELVEGFAADEWWFSNQFGTSMKKVSLLGNPVSFGEIRRFGCFRRNSAPNQA